MRLKFHHDAELESVIVRCPLENYQLLSEYQRKYPKAEIDEVLDGREDFNRLIRGKGFRLEDTETVNLLRFLNGQEAYLTDSEQEKVARILPSCHCLEDAMEAICNLDCFQLNSDGSLEQKKEFSYRYQANQGLPPVGQTAAHTVKAFFQGKPEIRWLFLPMTEEKERHLKKQLGIFSWAGHSVELVTLEPAMLGAYLPSTGHTVDTLQQLATILQRPEFQQKAVQERCAAALLVQQPQNLKEACQVLERNQNYILSQQKTLDSVQTKFGYLHLNGEAPLHPLENGLVTSWL